jgi:fucose permease
VLIVVLYLARRRFRVTAATTIAPSSPPPPSPADGLIIARDIDEGPGVDGDGRIAPLGSQYWLSWSIVVLCVGIEFCMTLWCAQLLRDRANLSAAVAATGVTAVVLGMTVGRLFGARIAARRDIDWMLLRAFALTAVGFALFWFSRQGVLSFAGLAICGLGMASHYPLSLARAIRAAGGDGQAASAARSDVASSRVSVGTGVAIGLAPFVLGFLADHVGIAKAFLLVPVLLATATAALLVARRVPVSKIETTVRQSGLKVRL